MSNVVLISNTPDPERTIALAARLCYSPKSPADLNDTMTDQEVDRVLNTIIKSGHGSALEHASFTFGIEEISRAATHQLVRHRLASYNQQSQRYVDERKTFGYVVPPTIKDNHEFLSSFPTFTDVETLFKFIMEDSFSTYQRLLDAGIPKEDARYVLPNACFSNIVVTMNVRELLHFFNLRLCNRAQWEIREAAEQMLVICREVAPKLFRYAGPSCVYGKCGEGKMTCGNPRLDLRV